MERAHLDECASFFAEIKDDDDDAERFWSQQFKEHVHATMRLHTEKLTAQHGEVQFQRFEVTRARIALNQVAAERLQAWAARLNPNLALASEKLRLFNARILEEDLSPATKTAAKQNTQTKKTQPERRPCGFADALSRANFTKVIAERDSAEHGGSDEGSGDCVFSTKSLRAVQEQQRIVQAADVSSPRVEKDRHGERSSYGSKYCGYRIMRSEVIDSTVHLASSSLPQLRSVMASVYFSKIESDVELSKRSKPLRTMEQHFFTWLSARYRLREQITQWALSIFRSVEAHAKHECDVLVFGRILQNALPEGIAILQDRLKGTAEAYLQNALKEQIQLAGASDHKWKTFWLLWMSKGVPYWACKKLVCHLYRSQESSKVLARIAPYLFKCTHDQDQEFNASMQTPASAINSSHNQQACAHRDLLQVLLRFQLDMTEAYIADFKNAFHEIDADDDGVLSAAELHELCSRLGKLMASELSVASALQLQALEVSKARTSQKIEDYRCPCAAEIFSSLLTARCEVLGGTKLHIPR